MYIHADEYNKLFPKTRCLSENSFISYLLTFADFKTPLKKRLSSWRVKVVIVIAHKGDPVHQVKVENHLHNHSLLHLISNKSKP